MLRPICADLHVHSDLSDGNLNIRQIFRRARKLGNIKALVITDHNIIGDYSHTKKIAQAAGIRTMPGIDITSFYNFYDGVHLHILGYGVNPLTINQALQEHRQASATMAPQTACEMIARHGGKAVFAHPGQFMQSLKGHYGFKDAEKVLIELVTELVRKNLIIGVERFHPRHTAGEENFLFHAFKKLVPFFTAGSDYHGPCYPDRVLGNWGIDMQTYAQFEKVVLGKTA